MARGINKVILVGNLGQDPEVRFLPNGNAVANISIATSESWRDKNSGQTQERTEWHRVTLYGKLAEVAGEYLKKGSQVYIEGKLQTRKWQDQQGQDRYSTDIVVDMGGTMQMLGGVGGRGDAPGYAPQNNNAQGNGGYSAPAPAPAAAPASQYGQQNQYNAAPQPYNPPAAQKAPAPQYQQNAGYNAPQQQQSGFNQGGGFAPQQGNYQQAPRPQSQAPVEPSMDFDDDIPF